MEVELAFALAYKSGGAPRLIGNALDGPMLDQEQMMARYWIVSSLLASATCLLCRSLLPLYSQHLPRV